jgi:transposase
VSKTEAAELRRLAKSRATALRLVQRAQLIVALLDEPSLTASEAAKQVGFGSDRSGVLWVKRFNAAGIAGLNDQPRSGAPVTHTEAVRSRLIELARHKPSTLGYPFAVWSLERLQSAYQERHQLHLSRSTIWEWLEAEGFDWKRQASWFRDADKQDSEFVEKRGPSSAPT